MAPLILLFGLALADDPAAAPAVEPAPVASEPRLEDVWASLPARALLDEAVTHREQGDWDGAEARLRVLEAKGELAPAVAYQLSILAEVRERYPQALAGYQAVSALFPGTAEAGDASFREALVLNDLGRHEEALAVVRGLARDGDWEGADLWSLTLERGVSELGLGRTRRGIRHVQRGLDALEGSEEARWMRARGRAALLRAQLESASAISLENPKKADDAVLRRRALITDAEQQRAAIAALGEPEYVLEALLRIGDASLDLYEDVNAAPPPPEVAADPELAAEYQALVREQSARFREVAFQYYDAGVLLADRVHWQGMRAVQLRHRRDALKAAIEAELMADVSS